uniref:Uncharacterized protein n=1 Tax=Picea sitchensis TaxID=3332 RepID=B8LRR2_PICSI|nr:unknown [Picea sitchensis]
MGSQRLPLPLPPPRPAPGHRARGGREKKDNGFCVFNLPPFWTRSVLLSYKAFYHILLDVWVYDSRLRFWFLLVLAIRGWISNMDGFVRRGFGGIGESQKK